LAIDCVAIAISPHYCNASLLDSQRVLVTGSGCGIGQALAVLCAKEGADAVAITSRSGSELEETAEMVKKSRMQTRVLTKVVDVTDKNQVENMVKSIVETFGGIDVLINNAGGAQRAKGSSETLDSDDLRSLLDLNVVSVHIVTSAVLRQSMLKNGGRIVNISSRAGKMGLPAVSFYCVSKFALEGLTAAMAEELRDKNISIKTLSPGMVNTSRSQSQRERKESGPLPKVYEMAYLSC
jgi:NAD(P)-dependent dehydrogenase (short-subunit alcohol dehydrogenase family)